MTLPPSGGFTPNINVQIQPFKGSLQDYVNLSKQQFTKDNFQILNEQQTNETFTCEYSANIQSTKMHFYSKAIHKKDQVYLITATAGESQWKAVVSKLKDCVESFKLDEMK